MEGKEQRPSLSIKERIEAAKNFKPNFPDRPEGCTCPQVIICKPYQLEAARAILNAVMKENPCQVHPNKAS